MQYLRKDSLVQIRSMAGAGRARPFPHVSILIHLRVFFLPLRPSVRRNYPVSSPVSSRAVKLVHLALYSFLLTLRAETSR